MSTWNAAYTMTNRQTGEATETTFTFWNTTRAAVVAEIIARGGTVLYIVAAA